VTALLAGVVAGYGVAIPVGAIAPLLMGLSARLGLRVGASAALGVASADVVFATAAVLGGRALADAIEPAAATMRWAAAVALAAFAARIAFVAWRDHRAAEAGVDGGEAGEGRVGLLSTPRRAYGALLGLTLLNPTTILYFAALVLGDQAAGARGAGAATLFVIGVFVSSASWQLLLAGGGAAVGRHLVSPTGRLVTALASSVVIAALALHVVLTA
jgi:arginine exporter protein ArgO